MLEFIYERLAERYIFDVLRYLAVKVGDVTTAAQMVRMVVELHLLIVVVVLTVVSHDKDTNIFLITCTAQHIFSYSPP